MYAFSIATSILPHHSPHRATSLFRKPHPPSPPSKTCQPPPHPSMTHPNPRNRNPRTALSNLAAALIISTASFTPLYLPHQALATTITSAPFRFSQSLLPDTEAPEKLNPQWDFRSINSTTETFVVFSNDSDAVLDLWWVDYAGKEVYYASISPGTTHFQPSYASHPWVVREHLSQNSVLLLVAGNKPELAIVAEL